jgi:hypothetical protein
MRFLFGGVEKGSTGSQGVGGKRAHGRGRVSGPQIRRKRLATAHTFVCAPRCSQVGPSHLDRRRRAPFHAAMSAATDPANHAPPESSQPLLATQASQALGVVGAGGLRTPQMPPASSPLPLLPGAAFSAMAAPHAPWGVVLPPSYMPPGYMPVTPYARGVPPPGHIMLGAAGVGTPRGGLPPRRASSQGLMRLPAAKRVKVMGMNGRASSLQVGGMAGGLQREVPQRDSARLNALEVRVGGAPRLPTPPSHLPPPWLPPVPPSLPSLT